jgi:hypothetical protein
MELLDYLITLTGLEGIIKTRDRIARFCTETWTWYIPKTTKEYLPGRQEFPFRSKVKPTWCTFLFNLLRIKSIYMFRVLIAHCSSSGGPAQKTLGILRACYVSWLHQVPSWCVIGELKLTSAGMFILLSPTCSKMWRKPEGVFFLCFSADDLLKLFCPPICPFVPIKRPEDL